MLNGGGNVVEQVSDLRMAETVEVSMEEEEEEEVVVVVVVAGAEVGVEAEVGVVEAESKRL